MVDSKRSDRFKQWAIQKQTEVEKREKDPDNPGHDTPATSGQGYVMRCLYEAGCEKIEADKVDSIKELARAFGQSAAGMKADNPFEWLFLAYCGANGPVDGSMRSRCKRLALLLLFAQQQDVKPKHLMGRLYEEGGFTRINKLMRVSNPDLFARRKRPKRPASTHAQRMRSERAQKRAARAETIITSLEREREAIG